MATATATRRQQPSAPTADPNFRHLDGCPVPVLADDEEMAARVETYRVALAPMNDGQRVIPMSQIVTHCVECGAMSYRKDI